ncbi:non-specific serine/threonine protein kinase OS=Tsukamurella paurometabola (strain ATCC 8368 / DSM / CCUG 35730 / CIP 100753 / JCM 10117 / KCTC 9821 / NBRC 16120 / NCIMB 702349 / NCTC 13040) OX=521096 GN=Tpau_0916 PE=4 SV=1 [Tsukamurella paurometabola]|uniref:non-specific serine/threonine protein kinase n=1 Tax=Tsukamurella paurometabola (strain ATCC 8368 / DSM 20162 / CCUG 35730 / CIP 100753 / JCM 10117 / KCTC 9821 / NBRC 16120 / NCIMB 702349 / NCTC 13040) TaxID=521096 RepID=D5UUH9_TSUPD|nr:serine/threonine-protein kinase [Tsukamurella paurometabola]ADG77550.1 serine/threonine protein kinase [Tsukamurella paurometabola DSM 20162]SUP27671.1 Serine/threonine-protein kinase PrkC [Tsukamurella paurometabola]
MTESTGTGGATRGVPGPDYLVAGRYRLTSKIGGGGMGAVWLARDERLDRDVAAKQVISTEGLSEEQADELRRRALHEGRIAARLQHRNAISMYDVAIDRGEPWLVMEYLPSRSLAQVLHMTGTMPDRQVAQIGAQVADALIEAHEAGIIHRDIKPGNILIANRGRASGTVKLSDFGIARAKGDEAGPSGIITGTPAYFAPEVARGGEPSEASDLYSLGATLYTALEGVPPFGVDEDSMSLLHKVARGQIDRPKHTGPLTAVILDMLQPSPTKRPSLETARDRLAEVAAAGGNPAAVLASPLQPGQDGAAVWLRRSAGERVPREPRDRTAQSATGNRPPAPRPATNYTPPPVAPPSGMSNTVLAAWIILGFIVLAAVVAGVIIALG